MVKHYNYHLFNVIVLLFLGYDISSLNAIAMVRCYSDAVYSCLVYAEPYSEVRT